MIITDIKQQTKNEKRYSLFIDDEFVFGLSDIDVLFYKLKIGDEISAQRLNSIMEEVIFTKAKDKAIKLVSYKSRTSKELFERLMQAEFDEATASKVVAIFEKYKYVDDSTYAMRYTTECIKQKGYGEYRIRQALRLKGVKDEFIDSALEDTYQAQYEKAAALLEKRLRGNYVLDFKEKKKHFDFLVRRGYSFGMVNEIFQELTKNIDDFS